MIVQVNCKNCGAPFEPVKNGQRGPRTFCASECRIAVDRRKTRLRYRNDPEFRSQQKTFALNQYYARKRQAEGSGTAL